MASSATAAQSMSISRAARGPGIYHAFLPGFEKLKISVLKIFPEMAYFF
jgi:hypothetical protein